ncbi:MAG: hypothetical protein JW779_13015 [Candidatus Thorarchaeota archaeon]|nr:hypothetical protein [Candidatus Thorarchaeota archaeon]
MSIQEDKRVIKPSKMSERYARWFGTRVPSTSLMFRCVVIFFLSILWSLAIIFLFPLLLANIMIVFLISLALGFAIYILFLSLIRSRLQSTIVYQGFTEIVESCHERIGSYGTVEVWIRPSNEAYITSTYNLLFEAVIVSDKMVELILAMPQSGEAMLGYHLLRMPKSKPVFDILAGALTFGVSSALIVYFLGSLSTFYYPYGYLTYALLIGGALPILFIIPVGALLALRGAFWTHESAFERAQGMYKTHPQVAKDEVLSSRKLDEDTEKATVWMVKQWETGKRSGRRSSVSILTLLCTFMPSFYILSLMGWPYGYLPPNILFFLIGYPFVLAIVFFIVLRTWDKKCMGELYYETTQAHEPVWVD